MTLPSDPSSRKDEVLNQILTALQKLQYDHSEVVGSINAIRDRLDVLTTSNDEREPQSGTQTDDASHPEPASLPATPKKSSNGPLSVRSLEEDYPKSAIATDRPRKSSGTSRIILTTYPGQSGIDPIRMDWGNEDPSQRGPVVVSRHQNTVRRRNGQCCRTH